MNRRSFLAFLGMAPALPLVGVGSHGECDCDCVLCKMDALVASTPEGWDHSGFILGSRAYLNYVETAKALCGDEWPNLAPYANVNGLTGEEDDDPDRVFMCSYPIPVATSGYVQEINSQAPFSGPVTGTYNDQTNFTITDVGFHLRSN